MTLLGEITRIIDEWASLNRSPLVLKYLRAGRTILRKAITELCSELEKDEIDKINRLARISNITLNQTVQKPSEVKYTYTLDSEEEMGVMACFVIEQACKKCDGQHKVCMVRRIFNSWEVPPYREVVEDGGCEYAYKE
jgi:hypothetical protein